MSHTTCVALYYVRRLFFLTEPEIERETFQPFVANHSLSSSQPFLKQDVFHLSMCIIDQSAGLKRLKTRAISSSENCRTFLCKGLRINSTAPKLDYFYVLQEKVRIQFSILFHDDRLGLLLGFAGNPNPTLSSIKW